MVQWLELQAFTAKGPGSIPGQGIKIPQAVWCRQNRENKQHDGKIDAKELWVRSIWIYLFEWEKKVKIIVSHMNVHQRLSSAEKILIIK